MIQWLASLVAPVTPGVAVIVEILDQNPDIVCPWCHHDEIHAADCGLMTHHVPA
jgi:hypothetical protein